MQFPLNKLAGRLRDILVLVVTQSNGAGATPPDNGANLNPNPALFISETDGTTDSYFPNSNGGASAWPLVKDMGLQNGIRYRVLNTGVGGSRMDDWTGLVGATLNGSQSDPLTYHSMGNSSKSISVGTPCVEGQAGFDPWGLLADTRAKRLQFPQFQECIVVIENAESEGGTSAAQYQAALTSILNYQFNTGISAAFVGLSASGGNSEENMLRLQGAKNSTIAAFRAAGKPVFPGADMFEVFGMRPPLVRELFAPDVPPVHYNPHGQRRHAEELVKRFHAAGF